MKNWRTTVIGALGAAVTVAIQLVQTGAVEPTTLAISVAMAFLGYLAKDAGVSGTDK